MFTVLYFKRSVKKHCVAKILPGTWERFLDEKNRNYNSYNINYRFVFIPFFSFCRNQKQESNFQKFGDLVTRSIFPFCLLRVLLYFKGMPNSIDFHKKIFLHVIPVRIIVRCLIIQFQMNADFWRETILLWIFCLLSGIFKKLKCTFIKILLIISFVGIIFLIIKKHQKLFCIVTL